MFDLQNTLKEKVTFVGRGLHTGVNVTMSFLPAPANTGYIFRRVDLKNCPEIKADIKNVSETSRSTTIQKGDIKVSTIEHTLAALVGAGIDNCYIDIDGIETPIMDGSSVKFTEGILSAGIEEQNEMRKYLTITESITFRDEDKNVDMIALPYDGYKIATMIDFNSKVLGPQHAVINKIEEFEKEISSARTFCFLHELEVLLKNNLIKGGDLENAVVVVDQLVNQEELDRLAKMLNKPSIKVEKEGVLNTSEMRYSNEPARHKLLDVVGDLALVGHRIKGHIIANRPGHKTNVAFAKLLRQKSDII